MHRSLTTAATLALSALLLASPALAVTHTVTTSDENRNRDFRGVSRQVP